MMPKDILFIVITLVFITDCVCIPLTKCKVNIDREWYEFAVNLHTMDPFQVAKSVSKGETVLYVSNTCRLPKKQTHEDSLQDVHAVCVLLYKRFYKQLQQQTDDTPPAQTRLNQIIEQESVPYQTMALQNIIHQLSQSTVPVLFSSQEVNNWLSATSMYLIFHIGSGLQINDVLQNISRQTDKTTFTFVIRCSFECALNILEQACRIQTERLLTIRWLVIPTEVISLQDISFHRSSNLPSTNIVIVDTLSCISDDLNGRYSPIYKLEPNDSLHLRRVGHTDEDGHITVSEKLFRETSYSLDGKSLIVATLEWTPYVNKRIINGAVTYEGICIDLLDELSRTLNFSYSIFEPEDESWGELVNGSWTGLVGMLANKVAVTKPDPSFINYALMGINWTHGEDCSKVDLVAASLSLQQERELVMDFTVPYSNLQSGIILKKAHSNANKWLTLVSPYNLEVHICIFFSLIISTLMLFIMEEINPGNSWKDDRPTACGKRYADILWHFLMAIVAKGTGNYRPSSLTGRTILSCWWLFTVISAATYSGNLIAFLTDWREKLPFTSLAEMVEQDTYSWGSLGTSVLTSVFKNSTREDYQHIWKCMTSNPLSLSNNIEDHRRRVDTDLYAYLGDNNVFNTWKAQGFDFDIIYDPFLLSFYCFGLQNNSIYTRIISDQILRINELGLPQMWYKKWKPHAQTYLKKSAKKVDIVGLQSIFYAAGLGIVLASISLSIELMYKRRKRDTSSEGNRS